ncbi:hypothetical protein LCGC14_2668990 [marine sediment metagenome]|uniref:PpiC domain-containing protein n=1 Tax=marine sediment metagenome TaxID=412755 RepID=A0A0F8ZPL3_9ZZZZ
MQMVNSKTRIVRLIVSLAGRTLPLVLCSAVGMILLLPSQAAQASDKKDKPVVLVNGKALPEDMLAEVMQKIVPVAAFHGGLSEKKKRKYRPEAIKTLVDEELMFQRAEELDMDIDRSRVNAARKKIIKKLGGKSQYKRALKAHGISNREYRKRLRRRMLIDKFVKERIEDVAFVDDEEASRYYEENKGMYIRPEARRIRHIFISVPPVPSEELFEQRKERAELVLRKLDDGEDFAALAWDYSDGPYRVKGGDMGLLHKGRLDRKLELEVEKLEEGETSGIIRTIYGFHIAQVTEIRPEEQLSFEDVKDSIKTTISEARLKETREAIIAGLREKAEIEVVEVAEE